MLSRAMKAYLNGMLFNEEVIAELLKMAKEMANARAGMRRMVRKLLKKYKYPPKGMEDAIATVIGQCEMWVDT